MTLKRKIFTQLTNRQKRNRLHDHRKTQRAANPVHVVRTRIINDDCLSKRPPINEHPAPMSAMHYDSLDSMLGNSNELNNLFDDADGKLAEDRFTDSDSGESNSDESTMIEQNIDGPKDCFRTKLADCFVENNISHVQGNSLLAVIKSHRCLFSLPKDTRTLIKTRKDRVVLTSVKPGEYWHIGFVVGVLKELSRLNSVIPNLLEIDLSTDGVAAEKNGSVQYWPIQFRMINIPESLILIAGVYRGKGKPENAESFFKMLTDEVKEVFATGGIMFQGRLIEIRFRCFIADAPARAFVLNHKGHMSSKPCSKCMVVGSRFENRTMIFQGTEHRLRTDLEYQERFDKDHHKDGISPLTDLRISGVTGTPFEIMHLVHLGVVRKMFDGWVDGRHSRRAKLSAREIKIVSARLEEIKKTCPREFSRRPRPISDYKHYKATEFRQFLLYTGPVVLYGVLEPDFYLHFLLLHLTMRILSTSFDNDLLFAQHAMKLFVSSAEDLYGSAFSSYNVHGLLHVVDDVRKFGAVDSYSAYPFENNMRIFRKYVRHQHRPLQQFALRLIERDQHVTNKKVSYAVVETKLLGMHNAGPLPENCESNIRQFRKLKLGNRFFSIDDGNNTLMLKDRSLCKISNIIDMGGNQALLVRKYSIAQDFYNSGKSSSAVGIFKCSCMSADLQLVNISEIAMKCYSMPSWSVSSTDANTDEVIIMTLLHT